MSAPSLKNGLSFCYVGSLNNIFDENLTSKFLNQIALKYPVTFHLIGGGEKKNQFLKMLKNVKIIDHGIVYDETEKAEIYSQCHMALNLMKTNKMKVIASIFNGFIDGVKYKVETVKF